MKSSRWVTAMVVLLFGVLLLMHLRDQGPLVGKPAPDFTLPIAHGEGGETGDRIKLSDLRGSVVVLDFWASWCGPCRESVPHLNRAASELAADGVRLFGVNSESFGAARAAFVAARWGFSYPVLYDGNAAAMFAYEVRAVPSVFVIDKEGIVRHAFAGSPTAEHLIGVARDLAK